jgi:hypothetical protein
MLGRRSAVLLVLVPFLATLTPPAGAAAPGTPRLRLRAASTTVEVHRFRSGPVWVDLGVHLESLDAPFDLRVRRSSYDAPIGVWQAFHRPGGLELSALPMEILEGWSGLDRFLRIELRDREDGTVLRRRVLDVCPAGWDAQRVDDSGPLEPTYPVGCWAMPLALGQVWGIDRGWAVPPMLDDATMRIRDGRYRARVAIMPVYRRLFGIAKADAVVELRVRIRTTSRCDLCGAAGAARVASSRTSLTRAATTEAPDPATLPDLVALPAFGISTSTIRGRDFLDFGADIWNRGPSALVVEGFRAPGEDRMDAFQYFSDEGGIVGRAPVGSFDFDERDGHRHWHFLQFARYRLLDASQTQVVRSRKQSFCLAPTDAIDLTVDRAVWRPDGLGFSRCGGETSLWIREVMPTGWGDTYFQGVPGQNLNITGVPNGTYWIEVRANPLGALYDAEPGNDVELREVILSGRPGARTVSVAPWHGIDTEMASAFGR